MHFNTSVFFRCLVEILINVPLVLIYLYAAPFLPFRSASLILATCPVAAHSLPAMLRCASAWLLLYRPIHQSTCIIAMLYRCHIQVVCHNVFDNLFCLFNFCTCLLTSSISNFAVDSSLNLTLFNLLQQFRVLVNVAYSLKAMVIWIVYHVIYLRNFNYDSGISIYKVSPFVCKP